MGNETSLCCNNAYVNKNHEVLSPDFQHHRGVKMPEQHRRGKATRRQEDKENEGDEYEEEDVGYGGGPPGEMQISDKYGENETLVKHIRQTSSIASSVGMNDVIRVQKLAKVVKAAPEVHLKVMSSGKIKG